MIDKNIVGCVGYIWSSFKHLDLTEKQFIPRKTVSESLDFTLLMKHLYYLLIIRLNHKRSET